MTRRLTVWGVAAAVALVSSACGGPKPSLTFGGKAVPVNVSFGKPGEDEPRAPKVPFVLGPVLGGVGVVPVEAPPPKKGGPRVQAPLPPPAPPAACPAADVVKPPLDEATRYLERPPRLQTLSYRIEGKVDAQEFKGAFDREVGDANFDPTTGRQGFSVTSKVLGVTTRQLFESLPARGSVPGFVGLRSVEADGDGIDARPSFSSPKPLTLMPLDAVPGASWTDTAFDALSQTTYRVSGTIVGKDKVWACGENLDAWQVKITQEVVSRLQSVTSEITDWIATQYGGLIVQESASWTGTAGLDRQPVQGQYVVTVNQVPQS